MENYLNKFPVVSISLKGIEESTFDRSLDKLKYLLMNLFESFSFLLLDDLSPRMREIFENIRNQRGSIVEITDSLQFLSMLLYKHYGKKVILLIDEYDVPLAKSDSANYYQEMIDIIRPLFLSALKGNDYLEFAVLTGCLRVSKESLFTGLNNLKVYSLTDSKFSSAFGFTNEEVSSLLEKAHLEERSSIIKEWYDGYKIGKDKIYCPWDVVQYISVALDDPEAPPANYWSRTSGNDAIKTFLKAFPSFIQEDYSRLLEDKSIKKKILSELTYGSLYSSADNIWTLFFHTGYLTLADRFQPNGETELIIPNEEIRRTFLFSVENWFSEKMSQEDRSPIFNALFKGDEKILEAQISEYLRDTISYYDYRKDFYHAFVAGLFAATGDFRVESNKEKGEGRPDLIVRDSKGRKVAIIEFKVAKKKEDIECLLDSALSQIEERGYASIDDFERSDIFTLAIVFYKKNAYVKYRQN